MGEVRGQIEFGFPWKHEIIKLIFAFTLLIIIVYKNGLK